MLGEPPRCSAVKVFDLVGTIPLEPTTEKLREHLMVAEPVPVVIDVLQEETSPLDLLEHGLPAGHIRQRRREAGAGPLGDRRQQQEVEDLRFQCVQDILGQEFADDVVAARQVAEQARRVVVTPKRQACKLKCCDPTVGGCGQRVDVAARQVQPANV